MTETARPVRLRWFLTVFSVFLGAWLTVLPGASAGEITPAGKQLAKVLAEGPQIVQAGKYNHNSTTVKEGFKNHPGAFEDNFERVRTAP